MMNMFVTVSVFMCVVGVALVSPNASAAKASPLSCPDQQLRADDVAQSRAERQPGGASQNGSAFLPLEALTLPTAAQRREFMLATIRRQMAERHSSFDLTALDRVLQVMRGIAREKFLTRQQKNAAYLPLSLDIGFCQTLSDPYIIALMTAAAHIQPRDNILDVGTGSGYQAAIISRLGGHVLSLEIVPKLAQQARKRLKHLGFKNVEVEAADGFGGWPALAPFDDIIVAAGATAIPQPLLDQLKPGGRLLMPVGPTTLEEEVVLATKSADGTVSRCSLGLAAFVPMTGEAQSTNRQPVTNLVRKPAGRLPECFTLPVT